MERQRIVSFDKLIVKTKKMVIPFKVSAIP